MKASYVLRCYAAGERNFRGVDLRGQSFKGQDLSEADFSYTNIQGTDFTNAILKGANFTGAKAGQHKRWVAVQAIILLIIWAVLGCLSALGGYFLIQRLLPGHEQIFIGGAIVVTFYGAFLFTTINFGIAASLSTAAGSIFGAVFGALVLLGLGIDTSTGAIAGLGAGIVAGAVAGLLSFAVAGTARNTNAIFGAVAFASASAFAFAIAGTNITEIAVAVVGAGVIAIAVSVVVLSLRLSFYISRQALQGNPKFSWIRPFVMFFAVLGGTNFRGADLTDANFTEATVNNTNFSGAIQTRICWRHVKLIEQARVGKSLIAKRALRELLITGNGYQKSLVGANLQGANLNDANLSGANLKSANLCEATLQRADLSNADLTETLAVGSNFSGAVMTGVCLEYWDVDHTTNLEDVDCQYVYLVSNQKERRPNSGSFAPGEFAELFQKVLRSM
jgi:uncharacterized protein YjbI with pentapeptide repeats